jgi:hypothetical protein
MLSWFIHHRYGKPEAYSAARLVVHPNLATLGFDHGLHHR